LVSFIFIVVVAVVVRPHCMHAVHSCGLLLEMSHSLVCICLCVGHTGKLCKNGSTDQDAIWVADSWVQGTMCYMGVQIPRGKGHFWRGTCTGPW